MSKDILTRLALDMKKSEIGLSHSGSSLLNPILGGYGVGIDGIEQEHIITKSTDQTITGFPLLIPDPELRFELKANSVYIVKFAATFLLADYENDNFWVMSFLQPSPVIWSGWGPYDRDSMYADHETYPHESWLPELGEHAPYLDHYLGSIVVIRNYVPKFCYYWGVAGLDDYSDVTLLAGSYVSYQRFA